MKLKPILLFVLVVTCSLSAMSQNTMTKTQRWENSQFRVKTEHHRLMRLEISIPSEKIDKTLFSAIENKLFPKEGVIDILLHNNDSSVRLYYLDFVPLDYIQTTLTTIASNFVISNKTQLSYNSQEVELIRSNYFSD